MAEGLYISEHDYMQNESRHLRELSHEIAEALVDYGMSCAGIARGCRLDPRIVRRALDGIRISGDCERRILYFLQVMRATKPVNRITP